MEPNADGVTIAEAAAAPNPPNPDADRGGGAKVRAHEWGTESDHPNPKPKPKKQPMSEISSRNHEISTNIAEDPLVSQSRGLVQKILFAAFYCQQQRDPVVHPDTKFFV